MYQSVRYKIDQSDGSDDDSLATDHWYDAAGRGIKVRGGELTKTVYDRLGRATHRFILAKARASGGSDETAYADADDVADDIVMEEHQTVYENSTSNVLFTVSILRHAAVGRPRRAERGPRLCPRHDTLDEQPFGLRGRVVT